MPQSMRQVPVKQSQDEITVSVRELLMAGAMLGEVMAVLREHLFFPKGLMVIQKADMYFVYAGKVGFHKQVYASPSLAPCVEFALKYEESHD